MRLDHFVWASLMPTHWVMRLAILFGAGNVKYAPGTIGSLLGVLWYVTVFTSATELSYLLILLVSFYFAAGICGEAALRMGKKDPGSVILDEFVVMPLCYMGLDQWIHNGKAWLIIPIGFVIFRLLDITKPLFIGRLDQIEGGWGILLDDVGAALVTCLFLHLLFSFGLIEWMMGLI